MANIFRKKDAYIDRVNRSTFDLSFVNNLTMKFGAITPVCLLPASFGDSFQINARFNLQLLPTVFPIQTQMYVRLHFVYVRTRTLWEDWMSFFGGDETVTPPWMDPSAASPEDKPNSFTVLGDLQTGTLADYLGIPTTITGTYGLEERISPTFCSESPFVGNIMSVINSTSLTDKDQTISFITARKGQAITTHLSCTYSSSENNDKKVFGYRVGALPVSSDGKEGTVYVRGLGSILSGLTTWDTPIVITCDQTGLILGTVSCSISQDRQSISFDLDRAGSDSAVKIIYLAFPPISQSSYGDAVYVQAPSGIASTRITIAASPIAYASFTSQQWTKPEPSNCPFYTPTSGHLQCFY